MSTDYTLPPLPFKGVYWTREEVTAHGKQCAEAARAPLLARIAELEADAKRLDFLSDLVEEAHISSCFELDGGVHLNIERPSCEPEAHREKNNLREAIDAAMKESGDA